MRVLDSRMPPEQDGQLRLHAERCLACRTLLQLQLEVFQLYPLQSVDDAAGRVRPARGTPPRPLRRRWGAWISLSLALTAALVAVWERRDYVPVAAGSAPWHRDSDVHANTVAPSNDSTVQLAALSRPSARWPLATPIQWGVAVSHADVGWAYLLSASIVGKETWLLPVEQGLAPLAHSLVSTLHVLRSTWPVAPNRGSADAARLRTDLSLDG